jgi:hypothetical protein
VQGLVDVTKVVDFLVLEGLVTASQQKPNSGWQPVAQYVAFAPHSLEAPQHWPHVEC